MESKIYEWIEFKPHPALRNHIDIYWVSSTNSLYVPSPKKIFPDGGTELIANTGNNILYLNETIAIKPGIIYLGGTQTTSIDFSGVPNSNFFGVRFKPGGFNTFFRVPLTEIAGQIIEMQVKELEFIFNEQSPMIKRTALDEFFLQRLNTKAERFLHITNELYSVNGNVQIEVLSKKHDIGFRALERLFHDHVGISAKELSRIIRFQAALKCLKDKANNKSLLHMAFDLGYYDHSHLTNEVKKITGLTPSELRSRFKTETP